MEAEWAPCSLLNSKKQSLEFDKIQNIWRKTAINFSIILSRVGLRSTSYDIGSIKNWHSIKLLKIFFRVVHSVSYVRFRGLLRFKFLFFYISNERKMKPDHKSL